MILGHPEVNAQCLLPEEYALLKLSFEYILWRKHWILAGQDYRHFYETLLSKRSGSAIEDNDNINSLRLAIAKESKQELKASSFDSKTNNSALFAHIPPPPPLIHGIYRSAEHLAVRDIEKNIGEAGVIGGMVGFMAGGPLAATFFAVIAVFLTAKYYSKTIEDLEDGFKRRI